MMKAVTDFAMTFSRIHAFGGIWCRDLNHHQHDGMCSNLNLCQPDLMRMTANDLFPMNGIELAEEDFLLLGSSDLMLLME